MRIKQVLLLGIILSFAGQGYVGAQAVNTFDYTLETLRQSVSSLMKENQDINAKNIAMRAQINQLSDELKTLQVAGSRLEIKKAAQLQKGKERMSGVDAVKTQLAHMEDAQKGVDQEIIKENDRIKVLENEDRLLQQKVDDLSTQISESAAAGNVSEEWRKDVEAAKLQRDNSQKSLYEVAGRLEESKKAWQDINLMLTTGPQQLEVLKAEQAKLEKALPDAEKDFAKVKADLTEAQAALDKLKAEDYSEARVQRLDADVKAMGEDNRKLEADIFSAQKISEEQMRRFNENQETMRVEYESKFQSASIHNQELRKELHDLREEMVALDKKKSELEALIYPAQ